MKRFKKRYSKGYRKGSYRKSSRSRKGRAIGSYYPSRGGIRL